MGEISKYKVPIIIVGVFILIYLSLVIISSSFEPFILVKDDSMTHHFNYNSWMDEFALCDGLNCTQEVYLAGYNITKRSFLNFPFVDGIKKGSWILISKSRNVKIGDVVVLEEGGRTIKRILDIKESGEGKILQTKTDMAFQITDQDIIILRTDKDDSYLGKALFKLF